MKDEQLYCGDCKFFEFADIEIPVPGCKIRKGYFAFEGRQACPKFKIGLIPTTCEKAEGVEEDG